MTPFGLMTGPAFGGLGLMQPTDELDKSEALRMALMQAGLGIMSARTGGNLGAALGQGGLQGLQAYQQNLQGQKQDKRLAAQDAMSQAQFGMQQRRFEAEQESAAEKMRKQKQFEEAVRGAYTLDEQGNVTGIDQQKYMAALASVDPDAYARMTYQQQAAGSQPYYQFLPSAQGYVVGNARTGELSPGQIGGQPVMPGALDPNLQARLTSAKTGAEMTTQAATEAQLGMGAAEAKAAQSLQLIDAALQHPGRKIATGLSSKIDPRNLTPGTEAYDFGVLAEQIKGQAFLEAFQSLKGAGAITDREGAAATAAMARLNTAQSDEAYESALKELRSIITSGLERQRRKITPDTPLNLQLQGAPQPQQGGGWGIRKL